MNLSQLNKREKILGFSTVFVIVLSLFYICILKPQIKSNRALQKKLNNLKIKYTKMQTDVLMRDRINNVYEQVEHLLGTADTEQRHKSLFAREVTDIYSNKNIQIKSIDILKPHIEPYYTQLSLKVVLVGNIKEFLKLVEDIESLDKPICIESFELHAQDTTDMVRVSLIITKIVKIS